MDLIHDLRPDGARVLVGRLPEETPRGKRRETERQAVLELLRFALADSEACIDHLENGAPFIIDHENLCISISHSRNYAALALGFGKLGVDIEEPREQLWSVAPRVLSTSELEECPDLSDLLRAWTIKEALYKLHPGPEACDFRSAMSLDPPTVMGHPARIVMELALTAPPAYLTLLTDQ